MQYFTQTFTLHFVQTCIECYANLSTDSNAYMVRAIESLSVTCSRDIVVPGRQFNHGDLQASILLLNNLDLHIAVKALQRTRCDLDTAVGVIIELEETALSGDLIKPMSSR